MLLPIIRYYALYLIADGVGMSLLMLFASQAGYSPAQMALYTLLYFSTPVWLIPLARRLPTRRSFLATTVLSLVGYAGMTQLPRHVGWYYAIAPLFAARMLTFWIVYMTRHMTAGQERRNAYNSSVIVAIMFGAGCVTPVIAGSVAQIAGALGVIAASVALHLVALSQVPRIKPRAIDVRLRAAWPTVPRYARTLIVLQGMYETFQFMFLPICTTTYLTEPLAFGAFFSVLVFFGSGVNLLISRWSDQVGNRSRMIYVGWCSVAVGLIGLATARTVGQWSLFTPFMLAGFAVALPYMFAILLDAVPTADDAFAVREWTVNVGRVISAAAGLLVARLTGDLQHVFWLGLGPIAVYLVVLRRAERAGRLHVPPPAPPAVAVAGMSTPAAE